MRQRGSSGIASSGSDSWTRFPYTWRSTRRRSPGAARVALVVAERGFRMPETMTTTSFTLSRVVEAPSERVFAAWTEPKMLKRWWGPPGFTTPTAEVDLRVGGAYKLAMTSPGGDTYVVFGKFVTIDAPKKLAYTWAWEE